MADDKYAHASMLLAIVTAKKTSTKKRVYTANVYPPKMNTARAV